MELNHDWRGFQAVFHPYRRKDARQAGAELTPAPIFVVTDKEIVLATSIEGQDGAQWVGQPLTQLTTDLPGREVILFEREDVERWLNGALAKPHFFEQAAYLRENSQPRQLSGKGLLKAMKKDALSGLTQQHFLLEAIETWWRRITPRAYGLYIRLNPPKAPKGSEPKNAKEIFLLIRRGRIDLFHEPDLSGMGPERQGHPEAVVKYLSQRHMVRVQGLVASEEDWAEWSDPSQRGKAWRKLVLAVRARRAKLVPFRWRIAGLLASRGIFRI